MCKFSTPSCCAVRSHVQISSDASLAWWGEWVGAFTTALLFEAGKFAVAAYIGMQGFESAYGAASSFVVLLVWIYYASQLVLFGMAGDGEFDPWTD